MSDYQRGVEDCKKVLKNLYKVNKYYECLLAIPYLQKLNDKKGGPKLRKQGGVMPQTFESFREHFLSEFQPRQRKDGK